MISRFLRHPSWKVFTTCMVFGLVGVLLAQQTGEKLVRVNQAAQITDAVMISNVAVAGKTIECGLFVKAPGTQLVAPFQAGSDWLQQMTISLVNRTDKTIVFSGIIMHFLDTGDCSTSQPCAGATLELGQRPAVDAYDGRTGRPLKPQHPERPPLDWKSKQTIVVHISDYMADIEGQLANFLPVTAVSKVNVCRGVSYFEDGMHWYPGAGYGVPDPEHPGKFKDLPATYFPGRRDYNWPPGQNR